MNIYNYYNGISMNGYLCYNCLNRNIMLIEDYIFEYLRKSAISRVEFHLITIRQFIKPTVKLL